MIFQGEFSFFKIIYKGIKMKKLTSVIVLLFMLSFVASCEKKPSQEIAKVENKATEAAAQTSNEVSAKKYSIKSGIIEYSNIIAEIEEKEIVYFDDYGIKECKDTYKNGVLKTSYFSDGVNLFKIIYKDKSAYNVGKASRGTEFKCDWSEIGEKQKSNGEATKLANLNILGKDCEQFSLKTGDIVTTFAGWSGVLLHMEQKTKYGNSLQKAVKFEENANVSPDKFKVPAGFVLK